MTMWYLRAANARPAGPRAPEMSSRREVSRVGCGKAKKTKAKKTKKK